MNVAQLIKGVIVNADSAQIYSDLPILSAAPTKSERLAVDHRLFGIMDGSSPCSAAEWATMARREIKAIQSSAQTPIIVGGTGLYLKTLLDGIAPVPPIDPEIRARIRETATENNLKALKDSDPDAANNLYPSDTTRINRALEVVLSTGRSLKDWQKDRTGGISSDVHVQPLILLPPRPWLYGRSDERFEQMVRGGAIDEVEALIKRKLDPNLPVMRAIGVREISAFLSGASSLETAIQSGQQATRQYAKRQFTWFAHQLPENWPRFCDRLDSRTMSEAIRMVDVRVAKAR